MPELPARYIEFLSEGPLFRDLDARSRSEFISALEVLHLAAGASLVKQGEQISHLFVLCSGSLALTAAGREGETRFVCTLEPGETVGGWMFCTDDDRSYTGANALHPADVAQISREAFADFTKKFPAQSALILAKLATHERRMRLLLALHSSQLFGDLDELALRELQLELELTTFRGGEVLCRQGDPGDSLFLVVNGRLRVTVVKPDHAETVIGELGRGEIVGEMAVVSGEPRTGTVYAVRDTQVAVLSRESFHRLLYRHPEALFSIVTNKVVQRLRNELSRTGPVHESISTIAVVPSSAEVDLDSFCERLTKSLSEYGRVCHLSSERADSQLGNRGLSQSSENSQQNLRLVEWLGKLESEYRFVVYQTESVSSEWTKRCLRQADRVLLVAKATATVEPGRVEELLSEYQPITNARRSLVLLHGDGSKEPTGTKAWLQNRRVEHHYHVRLTSPGDIDRLARHVIGCATGLVLGGGFARGMVHIGVIRALQHLGIPIDAIGGNSMGALMAAEYAIGWDLERMLRDTAGGCAACVSGMTLPMVAFKTGGDYSELVCDLVGDRQIEDLWLPYFCVSANLNRAELKVHTDGALAKAILASSRVPGVFPPIVYDGEMHVDGGVLNNVPVDVMRGLIRSGVVIGVDAVPSRQFDLIEDYGMELNGWRTALQRWNPFRRHKNHALPHIIQIMLRTIEFGGVTFKRANSQIADLYLTPPLQGFKPTDFENAEAIRDIGYEDTIQRATEWLAKTPRKIAKKVMVAEASSAESSDRSRVAGL